MASMRLLPISRFTNAPTKLWQMPDQMRKRAGQRDERYGIGMVEEDEEDDEEEEEL